MADITSAYSQLGTRAQTPIPSASFNAPVNIRGSMVGNQQNNGILQFPTDASPHHFVIVEGEFVGAGGNVFGTIGNLDKVYKLPLPVNLTNEHQVMYDADFNWLSVFTTLGAAGLGALVDTPRGGWLAALAGAAARVGTTGAQAAGGFAVNTMKQVTLATPRFRRIPLEWRLYPKTAQESETITRIVHGLQTGMHPKRGITTIPGTNVGLPTHFSFPKIYLMYFASGSQHLYKFKPAVLERISIDYAGGAGVPAFYKGARPAPQGLVIRTAWLELELWTRDNFENDTVNGMPTNSEQIQIDGDIVPNAANQDPFDPGGINAGAAQREMWGGP